MSKFTRIKGSDKPQNIIRLPRIGKIRLGIKKTKEGGKEYPAETDYFVCPPEVQALYGEEPKSLPVMLPVEDEEKFLRQYYACYGGNQKLKCQGDGEVADRRVEGVIESVACLSPTDCEFGQKNKCSARTDIMFVLPEINCGGAYQISTGSINSDIDIRSGIEMARHLFGRISWVPMTIKREEMKIPDPTTGNMQTHWPVKLYPNATVAQANSIREDTKRILDRQSMIALEEPVIESEGPESPELEAGESRKDTTKNFDFLKHMKLQKERVGEKAYYKVLGVHGVEKSNEVIEEEKQKEIFRELARLDDAPKKEKKKK